MNQRGKPHSEDENQKTEETGSTEGARMALRPDLVLRRPLSGITPGGDADPTPQLLVVVTYPPGQGLEKPVAGKVWKASPAPAYLNPLDRIDQGKMPCTK